MIRRIIALATLVGLLAVSTPVAATSSEAMFAPMRQVAVCSTGAANFFGFQPWYACLEDKYGEIRIQAINDILLILFPIVDALVKAAVYVAIVYIFWMIFKIILARGDSGKIAQASLGIRDAVVGMVIALIAIAIINFVTGAITG